MTNPAGIFPSNLPCRYSASREYAKYCDVLRVQAREQSAAHPDDPEEVVKPSASMHRHAHAHHIQNDDEDELVSGLGKAKRFLTSLARAKESEKVMNEDAMTREVGRPIRYNDVIQLKHKKSRKYLSVNPLGLATLERENLRIYLADEGSSSSWFRLNPWFKINRNQVRLVHFPNGFHTHSLFFAHRKFCPVDTQRDSRSLRGFKSLFTHLPNVSPIMAFMGQVNNPSPTRNSESLAFRCARGELFFGYDRMAHATSLPLLRW